MHGQHENREARIKQFSNWLNAKHAPLNGPAVSVQEECVDYVDVAATVDMLRECRASGINVELHCETEELAEAVKNCLAPVELRSVTITCGADQYV